MKNTSSRNKKTEPIMIRAYNNNHKGATAFFRNRPFMDELFNALKHRVEKKIKILAHASSVGAEPYSIALWWLNKISPTWGETTTIDIAATDIDQDFIEFAKRASYPEALLDGMNQNEQSWFIQERGNIIIPDKARAIVRFLNPMSFVDGNPEEKFDAVLVMNALTYVTTEEQSTTLNTISSYTSHIIGATAFHPDSIKDDMVRAGFSPKMENHREIHESWGDRLTEIPIPRNSPEYSWRLPPYTHSIEDYDYRFGALFERKK